MNTKQANKIIEKQLKDLDIPSESNAYKLIYSNAIEAASIMTKAELIAYIEEYAADLPPSMFE